MEDSPGYTLYNGQCGNYNGDVETYNIRKDYL